MMRNQQVHLVPENMIIHLEKAIARDDNKALNISFAGYMIGTGLFMEFMHRPQSR